VVLLVDHGRGSAVDATGGTSHATNVTRTAQQQNCLLVALPTGQAAPTDPAGYGGPRLRLLATLLQGSGLTGNNGGGNKGKVDDFVAFANGTDGGGRPQRVGATSTGITVDATNAYLGRTWETAVTFALKIPFGSLTPFPTVTATPSLGADTGHVVDEHDLIVKCAGADPNYFSPAGLACPPPARGSRP
jgi:hypothetical protein